MPSELCVPSVQNTGMQSGAFLPQLAMPKAGISAQRFSPHAPASRSSLVGKAAGLLTLGAGIMGKALPAAANCCSEGETIAEFIVLGVIVYFFSRVIQAFVDGVL